MYTSASAAVQVTGDSLSVHVSNVALVDVLEEVSQRGEIALKGVENESLQSIIISEAFQNLPIQAGLERLLVRLNYAFNREPVTGRITTLYLVSERQYYPTSTNLLPSIQLRHPELGSDSQILPHDRVAHSSIEERQSESVLPHEHDGHEDFITSLQE